MLATNRRGETISAVGDVPQHSGQNSDNIFPTSALETICSQIVDCPHSTPVWTQRGVRVLRSRNVRGGRLDLNAQDGFTDEEHYQQRVRRVTPSAGDLVLTREAPMGEVCMIPDGLRCCLGQRLVLLRPSADVVDGRYLLFSLQSPFVRNQILAHEGTGSTVSNLRIPAIASLRIPLMPLPEQRAIAAILGALDDKIELNRKMNETLEQMAQAIFKSWFIDFDGHTEFEDSELGRIPKGWNVASLPELAEVISGGTPKTSVDTYWNGSIPWASAKDVSGAGEMFLTQTERMITEAGLRNSSTKMVPQWATVVVARGATTGRFCMLADSMAMNQTCYALHSRVGKPFFLNHVFRSTVRALLAKAHGSIFDTITTKTLELSRVVLPPGERQEAFERTVSPLLLKVFHNQTETATLAELRDTLLPKLISGELRVKHAGATQ